MDRITVFVGNLDKNLKTDTLKEAVQVCGDTVNIKRVPANASFALCDFTDPFSAFRIFHAISTLSVSGDQPSLPPNKMSVKLDAKNKVKVDEAMRALMSTKSGVESSAEMDPVQFFESEINAARSDIRAILYPIESIPAAKPAENIVQKLEVAVPAAPVPAVDVMAMPRPPVQPAAVVAEEPKEVQPVSMKLQPLGKSRNKRTPLVSAVIGNGDEKGDGDVSRKRERESGASDDKDKRADEEFRNQENISAMDAVAAENEIGNENDDDDYLLDDFDDSRVAKRRKVQSRSADGDETNGKKSAAPAMDDAYTSSFNNNPNDRGVKVVSLFDQKGAIEAPKEVKDKVGDIIARFNVQAVSQPSRAIPQPSAATSASTGSATGSNQIDGISASPAEEETEFERDQPLDRSVRMLKLERAESKAYIKKYLQDLIGIDDEFLNNYLLKLLRDGQRPSFVIGQLEYILDDDALPFVKDLWAMLTESPEV